MRRLTGLDASFLYLETPNNHMHVGAVYVLDPEGDSEAASVETFRRIISERIHLLPPFRWRLVEVPMGLHHPVWINDPDFDLEYHVRRGAIPSPGGMHELADYAAQFMARPLDRSRPLWEIEVLEGLKGGRRAFLSKTHHAAIDGASGAELTTTLLDLTREVRTVEPPLKAFKAERQPSDLEMLAYGLRSAATQPVALMRAIGNATSIVRTLQKRVEEGVSGKLPFQSPRTSLNTPITPHRKLSTTALPLSDIKVIRAAFGGTVNDAVLAICGGALRRYLDEEGELPADPLVAMVPVSVRAKDQKGAMGNQVGQMLVPIGTHLSDPKERLDAISEQTKFAKETLNAIGASTLSSWSEFAAPAVAARAARLYSSMQLASRHRPLFNLTISNVPGPQQPLYAAGAKLAEWYPMGPIYDGAGLNITLMSYEGVMYVGLLACRETVPRLWDLAAHMDASMAELLDAAKQVLAKPAVGGSAPGTDAAASPSPAPKKVGKSGSVAKRSAGTRKARSVPTTGATKRTASVSSAAGRKKASPSATRKRA
jgi:diacylglycerol O-acyltransferase / wax synthase